MLYHLVTLRRDITTKRHGNFNFSPSSIKKTCQAHWGPPPPTPLARNWNIPRPSQPVKHCFDIIAALRVHEMEWEPLFIRVLTSPMATFSTRWAVIRRHSHSRMPPHPSPSTTIITATIKCKHYCPTSPYSCSSLPNGVISFFPHFKRAVSRCYEEQRMSGKEVSTLFLLLCFLAITTQSKWALTGSYIEGGKVFKFPT